MSLDYALVKCINLPNSLSELKGDPKFNEAEYRELALRLFPEAQWQADGTAMLDYGDVFLEVRPSSSSISISMRGSGDLAAKIEEVSFNALQCGAVTIDIQYSELLAPDVCESKPEYMAWYQSVVYGAGG